MEDFKIQGGRVKPTVRFSASEGKLSIEGRSLLEAAEDVFEPMSKWLEEYLQAPQEETEINVALEYFNSSTAKALIRFLVVAKKAEGKTKLTVNFYYDDENVLEYGKDFSDVTEIPFNFIEKDYH